MKLFDNLVKDNNTSSPNQAGRFIERLRPEMHQADLLMSKLHSSNDLSTMTGNDADF